MSIQKVIYQIEQLEKSSVLNSRSFIDQYGWEKLKEALTLYYKGLGFGIPQNELENLFKLSPVLVEEPPIVEEELPLLKFKRLRIKLKNLLKLKRLKYKNITS